jgi:hypothetical protein
MYGKPPRLKFKPGEDVTIEVETMGGFELENGSTPLSVKRVVDIKLSGMRCLMDPMKAVLGGKGRALRYIYG